MAKSQYTRKEYSVAELAYFAGIVDGEGCFYIGNYGKKSFFQTYILVSSTDRILCDWLFTTFGGAVRESTPKQRAVNSKCPVYTWACTGDRLTHLCECCLPYLVIKTEQARIMLEMRSTYHSGLQYKIGFQGVQHLPTHIVEKRNSLMTQLRSQHRRNHTNIIDKSLAPCHPLLSP